jgi:hypothetical protein
MAWIETINKLEDKITQELGDTVPPIVWMAKVWKATGDDFDSWEDNWLDFTEGKKSPETFLNACGDKIRNYKRLRSIHKIESALGKQVSL